MSASGNSIPRDSCDIMEMNSVQNAKEPVESTSALDGFKQFQNGSPGRIRTYNPPVNSRMLCR